jgi:hypothetical protein
MYPIFLIFSFASSTCQEIAHANTPIVDNAREIAIIYTYRRLKLLAVYARRACGAGSISVHGITLDAPSTHYLTDHIPELENPDPSKRSSLFLGALPVLAWQGPLIFFFFFFFFLWSYRTFGNCPRQSLGPAECAYSAREGQDPRGEMHLCTPCGRVGLRLTVIVVTDPVFI